MKLATFFSKPDPYKFRKMLLRSQRELNMSTDTFVKHTFGYTRAELEKLAQEESAAEATEPTKDAAKLRAEFQDFERRVLQAEADAQALEYRKQTLHDKRRELLRVEEELSGRIANHAKDVVEAKETAAEAQFNIAQNWENALEQARLSGALDFLSKETQILASLKAALARCQSQLTENANELAKIK